MLAGAIWPNLPTAAEVATLVGVGGGAVVAYFFARRANVAITAAPHRLTNGEVVIACRPSVTALGAARLLFSDKEGAVVTLVETRATPEGGTADGHTSEPRQAFPPDETGTPQYVNPGETLRSAVLFRCPAPAPTLVGWRVELSVASKGWVRPGLHWGDAVFVAVPALASARTEGVPDGEDRETPAAEARQAQQGSQEEG